MVERDAPGTWGRPKHLGPNVNGPANEYSPSVASDGTLVFGSIREGGRRYDLWRSRLAHGAYEPAVNLGDSINTEAREIDPMITPDGRAIVFGSDGRPDGVGGIDLYVSVRKGDRWSAARHLGHGINSRGGRGPSDRAAAR